MNKKMNKSLRLHPKYGANPTMPTCMFCGKERGDIALLGNNYKGEAPKNMVVDDEPCDECKQVMEKAFMLIEVRDGESGANPYRTGYIVGIALDRAKEIFPDLFEDHHRCCFIEQSVLKKVLGDLYGKEIT